MDTGFTGMSRVAPDGFHPNSPHCCICFDDLVIPVRPICFSCCTGEDRWRNKWCYTFLRICIHCADTYLQLDREASLRQPTVKCLICPKTVDPSTLTRATAYEIDFLYMQCLPTRTITCPYCRVWTGDLNTQLYNHIMLMCEAFLWECTCGVQYTMPTAEAHIRMCSHYSRCKDCDEHLLLTQMGRHMLRTHHKTLCCSCRMFIAVDGMTDHILNQCPERLVCCDVCMGLIRMRFFKKHLLNHYHESLRCIQTALTRLETEKTKLQQIVEMCDQHNIHPLQISIDREDREDENSIPPPAPIPLPIPTSSTDRELDSVIPSPTRTLPPSSTLSINWTGENPIEHVSPDRIMSLLVDWESDGDENHEDTHVSPVSRRSMRSRRSNRPNPSPTT